MSVIAPAIEALATEIAELSAQLGRCVYVAELGVTDREGHLALRPPTDRSPNGVCRILQASDGWIAVNLARGEDCQLMPAWLHCEIDDIDLWTQIASAVRLRRCADLIAEATLLGLPIAHVGEVRCDSLRPSCLSLGGSHHARANGIKVVDLSALWAGPLCGAVLAAMGAEVARIESQRRPDPTRTSTPSLFDALNGRKRALTLNFFEEDDRAQLRRLVLGADVVITSARARAIPGIGLNPLEIFAANPGLVWVAITGHGWVSNRVAFGDDAAAAGGLVEWNDDGSPRFLGDALADPLTGLAAAAAAMRAVLAGGGLLVDAAMAQCAAGAAAMCQIRTAA